VGVGGKLKRESLHHKSPRLKQQRLSGKRDLLFFITYVLNLTDIKWLSKSRTRTRYWEQTCGN